MDIDRVIGKTVSLFKGDLIAVEFSDNASAAGSAEVDGKHF